jgi:hypothetical protein
MFKSEPLFENTLREISPGIAPSDIQLIKLNVQIEAQGFFPASSIFRDLELSHGETLFTKTTKIQSI